MLTRTETSKGKKRTFNNPPAQALARAAAARPQTPAPATLPPAEPMAPVAPNWSILDAFEALPANGCRWPIGDPHVAGFRFCCKPRASVMKPYCARHCRVAGEGAQDAG
jgi:hypothetical protein